MNRASGPARRPGGAPAPKPRFQAKADEAPRHRGPKAKKGLGQHFLKDQGVLEAIVAAAELGPEDQVLEIGPGRGALTRPLLDTGASVVAVELDFGLKTLLGALESERPNLRVIWGDFMQTPWEALGFDPSRPVKVVANLPYYLTGPILMKLLQADAYQSGPFAAVKPLAERMLLMVQREVADRIVAPPGSRTYGGLSITCQYVAECSMPITVPAKAFAPPPKVDSAVVLLRPRAEAPLAVEDPALLFRLVRGSFSQRRKTLANGAAAAGWPREKVQASLEALGLDPLVRPEGLSLASFVGLSQALGAPSGG